MTIRRHFIQPGDEEITFQVPLSLSEIKLVHQCLADRYEADFQDALLVKPTQVLVIKLDNLIVYLEAEHYPDS